MFSRDKIVKAAAELADHLQVIENIRVLQVGQKELADAIRSLSLEVREIQIEWRALKAGTRLEALRETQGIVNAVQGGLNQRIEVLAVKLAVVENSLSDVPWIENGASCLPKPPEPLASSGDDTRASL